MALLAVPISCELFNLARAEKSLILGQGKAANLARMRAERLNGGLRLYRADKCMYVTGGEGCLVSRSSTDGYIFSFKGGQPGWQQRKPMEPTVQTTIIISADAETIIDVPYNGPIKEFK